METQNGGTKGGNENPTGDGKRLDLSGVKRGPGRPPGSGTKAKGPDTPKPQSGGTNDSKADAVFLADTVICLLEITDDISRRMLVRKVREFAPERAEEFQNLWTDCGLNEKDKRLTRMSVDRIAQKYGWLARFAPELLLLATLTQYGLRQARLHALIDDIAEEAEKKGRPINVRATPAPGPIPTVPSPVIPPVTAAPDPFGPATAAP